MVSNINAVPQSASSVAPARRAEVLQALIQTATSTAAAQWEPYAARLSAALLAYSEHTTDGKEANLSFNAANLLKKNGYAFYYLASSKLESILQRAVETLETSAAASSELQHGALSLVSYEEIEKRVLLGNVARPFETEHEEQLTALGMRLAALLGRDELPLTENPFRPALLMCAIDDAWREFNPDSEAHHLLLQLLKSDVFIELAPLLTELNDTLIRRGILPELAHSYRIRKSNSSQDAEREQTPAQAVLLQQLQRLFSGQAGPSGSAAGAAAGPISIPYTDAAAGGSVAVNQPLFDYLAGLQKNLFEQRAIEAFGTATPSTSLLSNLKQQTPPGAMTRVDENTIDLLAKIFEVIFGDQNIAPDIKTLIGFLQVPVLKAALIDKDFFFNDAHPARRMIDMLTHSGAAWDASNGRSDPLFQALQRNVERVQREFGQEVSVFSDVVSELESFIREEEASSASQLAMPIESALRQEKLGQATRQAKNQVALRLGSGEVVAFIETFLESRWVPVLTIAYNRAERQPQAIGSALKTMDDLIWSVKPKITPEQRKELITRLPAMLATLNKWLNLIEWEDADRLRFFAELAECHASIVRAPVNLSPERQLELALEVTQKAAERRLEKQANAQPEPERIQDEHVDQVMQLVSGTWIAFTQKMALPKKVKLAWISPMRSLYIFTTRDRQESFSMSDEALAQAFRQGRASAVAAGGLMDRALSQALESIGANDPRHDALAVG